VILTKYHVDIALSKRLVILTKYHVDIALSKRLVILTKTTDSVSLEKGKPYGREMGSEFISSPRGRDPVRLAEEEPSSRNSRLSAGGEEEGEGRVLYMGEELTTCI
jgi:hypothetical protein